MDARDELEDALAASWSRDTLAVYADHLQTESDPRGELIAIDLELERSATPALKARRAAVLSAWLGPLGSAISIRFGLVEIQIDAHDDPLPAVLASPLAAYLRRISIHGDNAKVERTLDRLSARRQRWLTELAVEGAYSTETVDREVVARFAAATPRLELLEASGSNLFHPWSHPSLRRLRVTGSSLPVFENVWMRDARPEPDAFAGVTELDLALRMHDLFDLNQLHLRSLCRLDLSRNEPTPHELWTLARIEDMTDDQRDDPERVRYEDDVPIPAFAFLTGLEAQTRRQLTHVRLPRLRSRAQFDALAAAVADMPALVEVEIARGHHYQPPDLPHPARFVRQRPWPWPAQVPVGDNLRVGIPASRAGMVLDLAHAIAVLEERFDELPAAARDAWTQFWQFVRTLDTEPRSFPADVLRAALGSCELEGAWDQLRKTLLEIPVARAVVLRRA